MREGLVMALIIVSCTTVDAGRSDWAPDPMLDSVRDPIEDTLCGDREDCRISLGPANAGDAPDGSSLWVVALDLLSPDPHRSAFAEHVEYWLLRATRDGVLSSRLLRKVEQPDGYGAGSGGSSAGIGPNRFRFSQDGGTGFKWGRREEYRLHPWELILAEAGESSWGWGTRYRWGRNGVPLTATYTMTIKCPPDFKGWFSTEFSSRFIPLTHVKPDYADRWPHPEIGSCGLRVSAADATVVDESPGKAKTDASLAAVFVTRNRLLVQIDGARIDSRHSLAPNETLAVRLSAEDHLELWLGAEPADYGCPDGWDGLHPPLAHWKIRLADGQALRIRGSDGEQITVRALTAPAIVDSAVLEIELPRQILRWGITVGFSQLLGEGKRRLIATSPVEPDDPWTLGAVGGLPASWGCRFDDGILNVTHTEPNPWITIQLPEGTVWGMSRSTTREDC
jgi:hypothetical protein